MIALRTKFGVAFPLVERTHLGLIASLLQQMGQAFLITIVVVLSSAQFPRTRHALRAKLPSWSLLFFQPPLAT